MASQAISSTLFHVHKDEMEWLEKYIRKHGKSPSKTSFKQQFPEFQVYRVDDVAHWCEEVRKSHKEQALNDLMNDALDLIDAGDSDEALALMQRGVTAIQVTSSGIRNDFDAFENWEEIYDQISQRVENVRLNGYAGVPTGFNTLDDITGGMQGGWFGVVAARLGQGKTWTGVKMAHHAAMDAQKNICYFSLEQSRLQISMRMHAFASKRYAKEVFNPMDLNRGKGFDLRAYKKFLQDLRDNRGTGKFKINDTSRGMVTPTKVAAVIESEQPDLVIIDYLTLLGASSEDWRGTAKLSGDIQSIAQRYNVPIWALSQVNRLGIGKEPPGAEHLSQADAIGQDADLVLTMTSVTQNLQKMKLAKFRHGPGGQTWYAKFSPGTGEYEEVSTSDAEAIAEADQEED